MSIFLPNFRGWSARLLLYALAFPAAVVLDFVTPLGIADWLIDVILVWVASVWGDKREMRLVAAIATVTMAAGLFSSPATVVPFWMGCLNRLVAILAIWTMVHVATRRQEAEQAERQAAAEVKVLQSLLPICAGCKAIRGQGGEWQRIETYLSASSGTRLTHGLCPTCAAKFMADLGSQPPNV